MLIFLFFLNCLGHKIDDFCIRRINNKLAQPTILPKRSLKSNAYTFGKMLRVVLIRTNKSVCGAFFKRNKFNLYNFGKMNA